MCNTFKIIILVLFLTTQVFKAQNNAVLIKGKVIDGKTNAVIEGVGIKLSNTILSAATNKKGEFSVTLPKKPVLHLLFSHISYQPLTKEIKTDAHDTLFVTIKLYQNYMALDTIAVVAVHKPETLVGKPNYSIYDFDFYEDKLLLLTAERSLNSARIQLSDYDGKITSSVDIPKQAGEALHFFHDYQGYTDIICSDSVFRLDVYNTSLVMQPVNRVDFNKYLLPIADTMAGNYYYNDEWEKYPSFNYYYLKAKDTIAHVLNTISNADLMKLYNLEYYYLPSRMQLEARRMADYYKTDKHIMAALMSGFTQSMYYEPLYAPLFILKDTICIFNHHNDLLYHYNKQNALLDSVKISYHHPKNWREWKRQLFVDEEQNKVYAFFSKNGHHYLKQIDYQTGKETLTYKLKQHSAEKIKIKNGYVYYVYRPFDSTQERFLYRERIE
jgi:hypothetical protein